MVLVLIIFWIYQGASKGYINTAGISDTMSSLWLKTVGFFKDPFASVRGIGTWTKPTVEEKKVGVEITNIQKADYYSSGKPIRINGKIEIFGLEKETVDVEVGCSLMDGDKEVSKGAVTIGGLPTENSDTVKIMVNKNEDVRYDLLCKFNQGAKVEKDEKGFNVLITVKYLKFLRVERLSVDTIASFKGISKETSSECRIGCGGSSGPVRLDLSTSSQPLTSIDSIYPLYISLSNIKESWKGSITNIEKLEIGFSDFIPEQGECDSFDITRNKAELKSTELGDIRSPVQCSAQNLVKTKFSNINECIEAARDKKEYDCWYKVPDTTEFVEGNIPKKHYITATLVFDYEFKSSTSITVRP